MAGTVEIVYPICCGMDVHKNFLVACIAVIDEHSRTEHYIRRFSTFIEDLKKIGADMSVFEMAVITCNYIFSAFG